MSKNVPMENLLTDAQLIALGKVAACSAELEDNPRICDYIYNVYSHSIVSGTYKHLTIREFFSAYAELTVRSTAKTFRLRAIDAESNCVKSTDLTG